MKYIIETDNNEDIDAMNMLINKYKVEAAFYDTQSLLHVLINRKFYDETDYKYDKDSGKEYVSVDWIERKVSEIYTNFRFMSDYE